MRPDDRRPGQGGGGIPDGLLIALLGLLVGVTLLIWSATGLAGLLAHGSWPDGVTFTRTPLAVRSLAADPQDIPAAWPDTPATQLSGYGLVWGLLISQLMVLLVLTVFVMGTLARWRAVREREKAARTLRTGQAGTSVDPSGTAAPHGGGHTGAAGRTAGTPAEPAGHVQPHTGGYGRHDAPHTADAPGEPAAPAPPAAVGHSAGPAPQPSGTAVEFPATPTTPFPEPRHGTPAAPQPGIAPSAHNGFASAPVTAASGPAGGAVGGAGAAPGTAPAPGADPTEHAAAPLTTGDNRTAGWARTGKWAHTLPPVVLGSAETRRPAAAQAVRDAEGPALVVTSDATLWSDTKDARAKLGPVLLYDPAHRCDTPARLHWSPIAGCEDKPTAAARATALLAPLRPTAKIDQAMADTAETLLRSYLHAAAIDTRTIRHLHRWSQGSNVQEAVRTLRTNPKAAPGAAGELESALTSHPERRDIAQELTARALSSLSTVNVRESCTPNRTDSLALDSFVHEGGTLYVVGDPIEDPKANPSAMPLLTALASSVVECGRRMAERSSSGRLDPPLTLVLDDVAAVAPLPQLPALLTAGADQGLPTLALLRSREQARSRWPHHELPLR
ncbi:type IV secretory system conjugative DNA transfer family protein [Streptomyces sp. TG1A-60]|uniref:type IV secretory system conjugative DNA transfer family protein n=1 Tax=Streptomyces sp. TG1A-60 TaxID=3129111 RepID=UPI0030D4285A